MIVLDKKKKRKKNILMSNCAIVQGLFSSNNSGSSNKIILNDNHVFFYIRFSDGSGLKMKNSVIHFQGYSNPVWIYFFYGTHEWKSLGFSVALAWLTKLGSGNHMFIFPYLRRGLRNTNARPAPFSVCLECLSNSLEKHKY